MIGVTVSPSMDWRQLLRAKHEDRARRRAARRPNARRRAREAAEAARRERARRSVVLVPGWAADHRATPANRPGVFKLDVVALQMRAAGWSFARIGRAYGVNRHSVWKWFKRRAAGPVERRRPAWVWRRCSGCSTWGWFRQNQYRREHGSRVFCGLPCYRARGRKPRKRPAPSNPIQPQGATIARADVGRPRRARDRSS